MTAERQVGERLSEQEMTHEDCDRIVGLDFGYWPERAQAVVLFLARQLAEAKRERDAYRDRESEVNIERQRQEVRAIEAERENGRLRKELRGYYGMTNAEQQNPPDREDEHARAEHLREAREVEDHQERKHAEGSEAATEVEA